MNLCRKETEPGWPCTCGDGHPGECLLGNAEQFRDISEDFARQLTAERKDNAALRRDRGQALADARFDGRLEMHAASSRLLAAYAAGYVVGGLLVRASRRMNRGRTPA